MTENLHFSSNPGGQKKNTLVQYININKNNEAYDYDARVDDVIQLSIKSK